MQRFIFIFLRQTMSLGL